MFKKAMLFISAAALLFSAVSCRKDPYVASIYKEQPAIVDYQDYLAETKGLPEKGTTPVLAYGKEKGIIKKSGLLFKDSNGNGKLDPFEDWRLPARDRATDLVKNQMTPEERLNYLNWGGQILGGGTQDDSKNPLYGVPGLEADGTITEQDNNGKETIAQRLLVDNLRYTNSDYSHDPVDQVMYFNNIQGMCERSKNGIPLFVTTPPNHDMWHGNEVSVSKISMWPYLMGLGAINDLSVSKKFGEIVQQEVRMRGAHAVWGPQADLATEPRWARIQHAIHAKGDIAANHIKVIIEALQGGKTLQPDAVASFIKHFPGSGAVEQGMDSHTYAGRYSVYPGNNFDEQLLPFKAAIDAGVSGVMTCYSIFDIDKYKDRENGVAVDEGSAFSTRLTTDLLKKELGFDGAVVSDQLNGNTIAWGHEKEPMDEMLADLLNAGTYQYLPGDQLDAWKEAYKKGLITDDVVINAAIHSLELQFKLGLFENPYVNVADAEKFWDPNGSAMKKRIQAGTVAMKRAVVLCKDSAVSDSLDILPIKGADSDYINLVDTNGNGAIDVYFDSAFPDADSGQAKSYASHAHGKYMKTNFVDDISKADVAIVRIYARGGTYFGSQGGIPLDFTSPARVWDRKAQSYTAEKIDNFSDFAKWEFGDWSNVGGAGFINQAYRAYLGYPDSIAAVNKALAAKKKNPKLKIIVGMTATRPGIVSSFVDKIDGLLIDFAATDDAFLDVVFQQDGFAPSATLPVEIPSDMASVEAQKEDVPGDTAHPTYPIGYGLKYKASGYGS